MGKLFNRTICLNNKTCVMCLIAILISTVVFASVWTDEELCVTNTSENVWVPTKDDIAYQDSMYIIIRTTNNDVKDIKKDIAHILKQLDVKKQSNGEN